MAETEIKKNIKEKAEIKTQGTKAKKKTTTGTTKAKTPAEKKTATTTKKSTTSTTKKTTTTAKKAVTGTKAATTKSAATKSATTAKTTGTKKTAQTKVSTVKKSTAKPAGTKATAVKTTEPKATTKKVESVKKVEEKKTTVKPKAEVIVNKKKDSMEDTVSLKEIRETLENKVNINQKNHIIKENIMNVLIAIAIVLYLVIVYLSSKHMAGATFETVLKVFSIIFAISGLIILEIAYKKDKSKMAISGAEVLVFGAINLCLMYVLKLYPANLFNVITYISIGVAVYYLIKILMLSIKNVSKFKKDNNDIKEIIKK